MKVTYKDFSTAINERLAEKQEVTKDQKRALGYLYYSLFMLMDEAQSMSPKIDRLSLQAIAEQVKTIEFQLQKNWNFPLDENFHSYWYQIPHCNCPKLDNRDRIGTDMKILTMGCPIHGNNELIICAGSIDGECCDERCPQLKDGEPAKTGRHCPLPHWSDERE